MGLFKTFLNVLIKKPVQILGNTVGSVVGYNDLGNDLISENEKQNTLDLQNKAIDYQSQATKYAADSALQGQREANQTNIELARMTNASNLQLAQQQNEWNLQQWQREIEYNSPANQMKLYKQAGLNPNLAQGQFSPASSLESAPLANQVAPTVQNPNGLSSQIEAQGAMAQANIMKDMAKNTAETMKASTEAHKASVEAGVIPKLTESQIADNFANVALKTSTKERIDKLAPFEQLNLISQYFETLANTELHKENKELIKAQSLAQKNMNDLFSAQKSALEKIPYAQLNQIINDIARTISMTEAQDLANQFRRQHGTDYSGAASMYSSNQSFKLGMSSLAQNESQFKRDLRQRWSQFNQEWNIRQVIAKNQNLTTLQQASLMAGAGMVNQIIGTVGAFLGRKGKMGAASQGMWSFTKDPADAFNGYYTTFGVPPVK